MVGVWQKRKQGKKEKESLQLIKKTEKVASYI